MPLGNFTIGENIFKITTSVSEGSFLKEGEAPNSRLGTTLVPSHVVGAQARMQHAPNSRQGANFVHRRQFCA
jgi:hypothetical protein